MAITEQDPKQIWLNLQFLFRIEVNRAAYRETDIPYTSFAPASAVEHVNNLRGGIESAYMLPLNNGAVYLPKMVKA